MFYEIDSSDRNSMTFSPQANCNKCATATCRQILVPNFADRGVLCGQHGRTPNAINLSFLDWSRYFFINQLLIDPHETE
jgi:hypothetical protein